MFAKSQKINSVLDYAPCLYIYGGSEGIVSCPDLGSEQFTFFLVLLHLTQSREVSVIIFDNTTLTSATRSYSVTPASWPKKSRHMDQLVQEAVEIKLHYKSLDSIKVDHVSH